MSISCVASRTNQPTGRERGDGVLPGPQAEYAGAMALGLPVERIF